VSDNKTRVGDGLVGGGGGIRTKSNIAYRSDNNTFVFVSLDNDTLVAKSTTDGTGTENLVLWQSNGTGNYTKVRQDNITLSLVQSNIGHTQDNNTQIQIASDGNDVFGVFDNGSIGQLPCAGSGEAGYCNGLKGFVYKDIGPDAHGTMDNSTPMAISTNDFCSTAVTGKMVIVVDNGSLGDVTATGHYGAGIDVFTLRDNATLESTATDATATGLGDILSCSLSSGTDNGTYILAVAENWNSSDNITVLKSSDLTTWSNLYDNVNTGANITSISVAAPNGTADVWVGISDGVNVSLWHSDKGTTGTLAKVHSVRSGGKIAIAHDNSSSGSGIIGISYIWGVDTTVDVYYE
jgi:hypothetical protein